MCLILFAVDNHAEYDLIIAANRDEFYERPTRRAHIWHDPAWMIAGKDLEGGGTWLGMDVQGRLAMLTNFRDPSSIISDAPSRGELVCDFFNSGQTAAGYLNSITHKADAYNGFNLVCADQSGICYFSNFGKSPERIGAGVHGLSNALLNVPWPKVERGKQKLTELMNGSELMIQELFDLLYDNIQAPERKLPDTGVGKELELQLSPIFIKTDRYGSRTSTVVLKRRDGLVTFAERSYDTKTFDYAERLFSFRIEH